MEPAEEADDRETRGTSTPKSADDAAAAAAPIVIVGAGPVGVHAARELARRLPGRRIRLFGEEPVAPYNRVHLSALLAGQVEMAGLRLEPDAAGTDRIEQHTGARIVAIDRERRCVRDERGAEHPYDRLILATGSRPRVPAVPGSDLPGVHTFRDSADVAALAGLRGAADRVAVIGGGLLGLETARGLAAGGTPVVVLEAAERLMPRQLDAEAAALLQASIEDAGIDVQLGAGVEAIAGATAVTGVRLEDGREIACCAVVFATGVVANRELAETCGLAVGAGVEVDDALRTSDPAIHAIGECAEHRGRIYGLAGPGLEQAAVVAGAIAGEGDRYRGSTEVTRLKVVERDVFSAGGRSWRVPARKRRVLTWRDPGRGLYRRLELEKGRLVAAQAVGEWPETRWLADWVGAGRRLGLLRRRRFRRRGSLAPAARAPVDRWPADATVCECTAVSRGRIGAAVADGACDVEALVRTTGAGSVCGSCRPLLAELAGARPAPEGGRTVLSAASLATAGLVAGLAALPAVPVPDSVQGGWRLADLWSDDLYRQVSGFTLAGVAALGLSVSLRKRTGRPRRGGPGHWRAVHAVTGALALALLVVHTGLDAGANLNRLLLVDFLALAALGAVTGGAFAAGARLARPWRTAAWWAHLLLAWPLPALLGYHVLAAYYF